MAPFRNAGTPPSRDDTLKNLFTYIDDLNMDGVYKTLPIIIDNNFKYSLAELKFTKGPYQGSTLHDWAMLNDHPELFDQINLISKGKVKKRDNEKMVKLRHEFALQLLEKEQYQILIFMVKENAIVPEAFQSFLISAEFNNSGSSSNSWPTLAKLFSPSFGALQASLIKWSTLNETGKKSLKTYLNAFEALYGKIAEMPTASHTEKSVLNMLIAAAKADKNLSSPKIVAFLSDLSKKVISLHSATSPIISPKPFSKKLSL